MNNEIEKRATDILDKSYVKKEWKKKWGEIFDNWFIFGVEPKVKDESKSKKSS